MDPHDEIHPPVAHRHLAPVPAFPPDASPYDDVFHREDVDDFGRRQLDVFRHLIEVVGSADALWALDAEPIPDEPFDWSAVEPEDKAFVTDVLAQSDQCCDALLDTEFRTIARRILARVAKREPRALRRTTRTDRFVAALVWLAGQASGEFGRRSLVTARLLWDWFGVSSCSDRGHSLRSAAGLVPEDPDLSSWGREPLTLGDPLFLHSSYRASVIAHRDALLVIAGRRRTWSLEEVDGRTAHVNVKAVPSKAAAAMKGVIDGRAAVIVGFGDRVEDAQFFMLSVPEAHELVRMVQHALDSPLPRSG
jgi:hypothetical protein